LLKENEVEYRYREYTQEPLSKTELKRVFKMLGLQPSDLLRKKDAANKSLGLTGEESATALIAAMAEHPTLLQRPIAIVGDQAVVGRPVENLLELIS
jgi:arsenate reductase